MSDRDGSGGWAHWVGGTTAQVRGPLLLFWLSGLAQWTSGDTFGWDACGSWEEKIWTKTWSPVVEVGKRVPGRPVPVGGSRFGSNETPKRTRPLQPMHPLRWADGVGPAGGGDGCQPARGLQQSSSMDGLVASSDGYSLGVKREGEGRNGPILFFGGFRVGW